MRFGVLILVGLTPGCIGLVGPETPTPSSLGEHPVGVTTITVEDPQRDRELTVEVWYPAAGASSDEAEIYNVEAAGTTVARLRSVARAHRKATPWRNGGALPVVLMSHGAGSSRYANTSLSEVLASHGYIVAAPDHAGHTLADKIFGIDDDDRAQSAFDRPIDLSRVLDALETRSRLGTSLFHGLVDSDRVAVAGHSMGGHAALGITGARFDPERQRRECLDDDEDRRCALPAVFGRRSYRYRDDRIKAALLISPGGFDTYRADGIAEVDAPVLIVGGRRDESNPFDEYPRPTLQALNSPHYLLELKDAGHLTATDLCEMVHSIGFLAKAVGGKQAQDGCGEGFMAPREALDIIARASLPFFELYLNGNAAAEERLAAALARDRAFARRSRSRRARSGDAT